MASSTTLQLPPVSPLKTFPRHYQPKGHLGGSWDHLGDAGQLARARQSQLSGSWDQLAVSYADPPTEDALRSPFEPLPTRDPIYGSFSEVQSPGFNETQQSFTYSDLQSPGIANMHQMYDLQSPGAENVHQMYDLQSPGYDSQIINNNYANQNYFNYDAVQNTQYNDDNAIYGTAANDGAFQNTLSTSSPGVCLSPVFLVPQSPNFISQSPVLLPSSPAIDSISPHFSFLPNSPFPQDVASPSNANDASSTAFPFSNESSVLSTGIGKGIDALLTHTLGRRSSKKKHGSFWNGSLFGNLNASASGRVPVPGDATSPRDSMAVSKGLLNAPGQNNCFLNSAVQVSLLYRYFSITSFSGLCFKRFR